MEILGTTLRICVDDLEATVAFYERLTQSRALRFERGGVSVAAVGCFLLMSGPESELEVLRKVSATIASRTSRGGRGPGRGRRPHHRGPRPDPGGPQPHRRAPRRLGLRVRRPARGRLTAGYFAAGRIR